jgi:hypothetical protein
MQVKRILYTLAIAGIYLVGIALICLAGLAVSSVFGISPVAAQAIVSVGLFVLVCYLWAGVLVGEKKL